jgi:release factor glutamine methyltransferase
MTTIGEKLAHGERSLAAVTETPRLDAEILLCESLALTRPQLLARLSEVVEATRYQSLLDRRAAHEPIAYILGEWEFYSLPLYVTPPLLVPRPETEHLVDRALRFIGDDSCRVLDLCTGTGCVAVAIAKNAPHTHVTASDINPTAVQVTERNAVRNDVHDRMSFWEGDLFDPFTTSSEPFDVISANPPYVEDGDWESLDPVIRLYEDPRALKAGVDGLDLVRRLSANAQRYLREGGLLAMEIGDGQAEAARAIVEEHQYDNIEFEPDLAGTKRILLAQKPNK